VIERGRAVGVDYVRGDEVHAVHKVRASREIVLSAGVIGSAQILMLSGIGPAAHLRARGIEVLVDLPGVGRNLHDHLMVPLRFRATPEVGHVSSALHFVGGMLNDMLFEKGWMGKTFLEGGAFVKSSPSMSRPDIQIHSIPWAYPEPNDDGPKKATISKEHSFTILPGIIYPKSRGEILLRSKSPFDAPLIDPRYFEDDDDMRLLVHGVRLTREIAASEPLAGYLRGEATPGAEVEDDDAIRAHVRLFAKTIYHPVGTCKMGVDELAVVDPKLKVRGLEGLRVADASIMPAMVSANTYATTLAIAEKAADMIRGRAAASLAA
jgi:choline dehydrogenase